MKRVGLDARQTRQMSVGMKAYARELSRRLPAIATDLEFVQFDRGTNFGWEEQVRLPIAMRAARVDLVHFLTVYTPVFAPRPFVMTIHDLIHLRFPEYFKSKVGPYYRTVVRRACAQAARIITDDERTIEDLKRFLDVDPAKVRVIALGVDDVFLRPAEPFVGPRPYILYVGNHRPHKDLPTLFAAWARVDPALALDLYLTGPDDFDESLEKYDRVGGRVIALGNVHEDVLASYYAGARALVHPALCEGFGLPMLEAMAAGCPVIACEDAIPGILRTAALTFPARDVAGLRAELERVLHDEGLRAALVNEGRILASKLTWDRCASLTADVYHEVFVEEARR
ncbi:MAG: glycosyltransferase family 4 protein [Vulcanimicrobiaceae bacterium]